MVGQDVSPGVLDESCIDASDSPVDSVSRARALARGREELRNTLAGDRLDLGDGAIAWAPCHIGDGGDIGADVSIGCLAHIGRNVRIGDGTRIQGGAYVADGCIIGEGAFIGPNATLLNDRHPPSGDSEAWRPVIIGSRAVIGGGATVVAGISIGIESVLAAGGVATEEVPDGEVWGGVPARRLMDRDDYERNAGREADNPAIPVPRRSDGHGNR